MSASYYDPTQNDDDHDVDADYDDDDDIPVSPVQYTIPNDQPRYQSVRISPFSFSHIMHIIPAHTYSFSL
jgi:hypothetical protein